MAEKTIEALIHKADTAIMTEDFATLMEIYSEESTLVVKPDLNAVGKAQILSAFQKIAAFFNHSLKIKQHGMRILVSGDTALVLALTEVSADNSAPAMRKATYIFKCEADQQWRCVIDNSYGHDLVI